MSLEQKHSLEAYAVFQAALKDLRMTEAEIQKEKEICLKMINEVKQLHYIKGWEFPK